MPRLLNYTLTGGENTTKGQRGLGDTVTVNTTNPTAQLDNPLLDNDLPSTLDSSFLNMLNGGTNSGADFTATNGTWDNLVNSFAGTQAGGSNWLVLAAIAWE